MNIEVNGFYVNFYGDSSVGIFDNEWKIEGYFNFDTQDDLDSFKKELTEAWKYTSDTPIGVQTFAERKADIKRRKHIEEIMTVS